LKGEKIKPIDRPGARASFLGGTAQHCGEGIQTEIESLTHGLQRICTHPAQWILDLACPSSVEMVLQSQHHRQKQRDHEAELRNRLEGLIPSLGRQERSLALDLKRGARDLTGGLPPKVRGSLEVLGPEIAGLVERCLEHATEAGRLLIEARGRFQEELDTSRCALVSVLGHPLVVEGLYLSSRNLFEAAQRYVASPPPRGELGSKSHRQFETKFVAHLYRSATKTTALHVLAGTGLFRSGAQPTAPAGSRDIPRGTRRGRLNHPVGRALSIQLFKTGELWKFMVPRVNPTWSKAGDRIRFWVQTADSESELSLPGVPLLEAFIEAALPRARTASEVIRMVHESMEGEYELEELSEFYLKLCEKGLLRGELETPFETADPLDHLLQWASGLPEECRVLPQIVALGELRSRIVAVLAPEMSWPDRLAAYERIESLAREILSQLPDHSIRELITVDFIPEARVSHREASDLPSLAKAVHELLALTQAARVPRPHGESRSFMQMLREMGVEEELKRKGEIPLLDLLRKDPGAAPSGAREPDAGKTGEPSAESSGNGFLEAFDAFLDQCASGGVDASSVDLEKSGFLGRLVPADKREFTRGAFYIQYFSIPRAGEEPPLIVVHEVNERAVLPFARADLILGSRDLETELQELRKAMRSSEQDGIWADVLMQSATRQDTVAGYTPLEEKVIEAQIVRSGRETSAVIPLNELLLSNTETGITLLWRRGDGVRVPIRPVFSSVLNQDYDSAITRVLRRLDRSSAHIQSHWRRQLVMRRGHLPRITVGNVILARETWTLPLEELRTHAEYEGFDSLEKWNSWRLNKRLPRFVFYRDKSTRPIGVDFHSFLSLQTLSALLRSSSERRCTLEEMLPDPEQARLAGGSQCQITKAFLCRKSPASS
jgi:hypothetical protein